MAAIPSTAPPVEWASGSVSVGIHTVTDAGMLDSLILALQAARREAFGTRPPSASVIEIIEPGVTTSEGSGSVIVPRDVRVNGVSVYTTGGVKVHEMDLSVPNEMATVTLTLPARRIVVAAEGDLQGAAPWPPRT